MLFAYFPSVSGSLNYDLSEFDLWFGASSNCSNDWGKNLKHDIGVQATSTLSVQSNMHMYVGLHRYPNDSWSLLSDQLAPISAGTESAMETRRKTSHNAEFCHAQANLHELKPGSPIEMSSSTLVNQSKLIKHRKLRIPKRGKCNFPCHRGRLRDHLQLKDASGVRAYWDARKVSTAYGICCTCYPRLMQTPVYECRCSVKHDITIVSWLIGCIEHSHTVDGFEYFEVFGTIITEGYKIYSYQEIVEILRKFGLQRIALRRNMIKITPIRN